MERKSGVLMHVSSLPGNYSTGGFGKETKYFIDFLEDCGFSFWQVLPFYIPDKYGSPYKSVSAFGGNPLFVDLDILFSKGLITKEELSVSGERLNLLKKAAERVGNRSDIEKFIDARPQLLKMCRFMALKTANNGLPWQKWNSDKIDEEIFFAWKFIQFEFFSQWTEIKKYANAKGVKIIGDMPIYVSLDSCDVWSNQKQYLLDENGNPTSVSGVPPDYFSKDGQLWGNPLYNWAEMKKDGFIWWRDRVCHMCEMFDAVRIDHFRAIESYWSVPAKANTAREGEWLKGPGMELVKAIRSVVGENMIIAEDLGDVTPEVYNLVKESGFPGMRVLQFGFLSDGDNMHRPHHYSQNCVAYTGTHDNNTMLGFVNELDGEKREFLFKYCQDSGNLKGIIRTMLKSHAGLVIFPIQDLLAESSSARMNFPGRAEGNWKYRITRQQLDAVDRKFYRDLNKLYSR